MSFSSLPRSLLLLSLGVVIGTSATYLIINSNTASTSSSRSCKNDDSVLTEDIVDGVEGLIGNTKLARIHSLSIATGCEILAKAEV
jgi:cysteine synthase